MVSILVENSYFLVYFYYLTYDGWVIQLVPGSNRLLFTDHVPLTLWLYT